MDIKDRIADRLRDERRQRGWSLDALAARAQVSRAMISKIERRASTPTAVLLARLADALGLPMSALMHDERASSRGVVTRLGEQAQWTDPASGYTRRVVSPALQPGDAEIVAVELPAHARAGFAAAGTVRIDGQIVLLEGTLQWRIGEQTSTLRPGDCVRFAVHLAHELRNPGAAPARYLVVLRTR